MKRDYATAKTRRTLPEFLVDQIEQNAIITAGMLLILIVAVVYVGVEVAIWVLR